jgi:hypothetical protein
MHHDVDHDIHLQDLLSDFDRSSPRKTHTPLAGEMEVPPISADTDFRRSWPLVSFHSVAADDKHGISAGRPSSFPSTRRPSASCRPDGTVPWIVRWSGLVRENGFFVLRTTVFVVGSQEADASAMALELFSAINPRLPALTRR